MYSAFSIDPEWGIKGALGGLYPHCLAAYCHQLPPARKSECLRFRIGRLLTGILFPFSSSSSLLPLPRPPRHHNQGVNRVPKPYRTVALVDSFLALSKLWAKRTWRAVPEEPGRPSLFWHLGSQSPALPLGGLRHCGGRTPWAASFAPFALGHFLSVLLSQDVSLPQELALNRSVTQAQLSCPKRLLREWRFYPFPVGAQTLFLLHQPPQFVLIHHSLPRGRPSWGGWRHLCDPTECDPCFRPGDAWWRDFLSRRGLAEAPGRERWRPDFPLVTYIPSVTGDFCL